MSDITIAGATFSDVTKIQIPKSGSGTAEFVEVFGSQTFDQNGTYDVSALAQAIVNVSGGGGGGGAEYEAGTWTPSSDTGRGTINFQNQHSEPPSVIILADATGTTTDVKPANFIFVFVDMNRMFGSGLPYTGTENKDALVIYGSRGNTVTTTISSAWLDDNSGTSASDVGYWRSNTGFRPRGSNQYVNWKSNRTYKWIAVWKPQS